MSLFNLNRSLRFMSNKIKMNSYYDRNFIDNMFFNNIEVAY